MNNTGGLNFIYVCPISNLTIDGSIKSREKLISIPFTPDTGERVCTFKDDKVGVYYDLSIKCKVPRSHIAEQIIAGLPQNFVLLTIDTNNITRIEGNRDEPLHYNFESKTGSDFSELNHVELKFYRKLRLAPTTLLD